MFTVPQRFALPWLAGAVALALTGCGADSASLAEELDACGPERTPWSCHTRALTAELSRSRGPNPALRRIEAVIRSRPFVSARCHNMMHTVGRNYAVERRLTLADLPRNLPRSNDPACPAGFAHGMISHVAVGIDTRRLETVRAICGRLQTRFRRYSCIHGLGHAFMRIHDERLAPALRLCRRLGRWSAPDCAQGAYHDYWFSAVGLDGLERRGSRSLHPRRLCASQPRLFVVPCWYRSFIDTRRPGYRTDSPRDLLRTCAGLSGLQRRGCLSAASVIGSPNPLRQFRVCASMPEGDVLACVRGVKVQNLVGTPAANRLRLIRRCAWLDGRLRAGCYEWFGRTLSVVTDGRFRTHGCSRLRDAGARRACLRGAARTEDALVTFS